MHLLARGVQRYIGVSWPDYVKVMTKIGAFEGFWAGVEATEKSYLKASKENKIGETIATGGIVIPLCTVFGGILGPYTPIITPVASTVYPIFKYPKGLSKQ